jgi:tetratricopeptide (TPR) repeat protein
VSGVRQPRRALGTALIAALWSAGAAAQDGVVLAGGALEVVLSADAADAVRDAHALLAAGRHGEAADAFAALAEAGGGAAFRGLEAVAAYEAGWLLRAAGAIVAARAVAPDDPVWLGLHGAVLIDLGRGGEALPLLARAREAGASPRVVATSWRNEAVWATDRGDLGRARAALDAAQRAAAGLPDVLAAVRAQTAALEGAGDDLVGRVSELLGAGRAVEAAALAEAAEGAGPREVVQGQLARAMVARARGLVPQAARALDAALHAAEEAGLLRETVALRLERASLRRLAGDAAGALAELDAAREALGEAHLVLRRVDVALAAHRLHRDLGDVASAERALAEAERLAAGADVPRLRPRLLEARAAASPVVTAPDAWRAAGDAWRSLGAHAEAARVGVEAVAACVRAGVDAEAATSTALGDFRAAGDALGPAHIALGRGIARARAGDVAAALGDLAEARRLAAASSAPGAARVAEVAEGQLAMALRHLGHDAAAGVPDDPVAADRARRAGREAFETGRQALVAGRYASARLAFVEAIASLVAGGDAAGASMARTGLAWARFNEAIVLDPGAAVATLDEVAAEAAALGVDELRVRARAAAEVARARAGRPDLAALRASSEAAAAAGLSDVAGRGFATLAEVPGALPLRAAAARRALDHRQDGVAVGALYSVAFDAAAAGDTALARALMAEIPGDGGALAGALDALRAALDAADAERSP